MQKQKLAAVISSFSVVLFVVVAIYAFYEPLHELIISKNDDASKIMESDTEKCIYHNDSEANKYAIITKDIDLCECIDDREKRDECKKSLLDILLYDRALAQLDSHLCEKISSDNQKTACQKNTKSFL